MIMRVGIDNVWRGLTLCDGYIYLQQNSHSKFEFNLRNQTMTFVIEEKRVS